MTVDSAMRDLTASAPLTHSQRGSVRQDIFAMPVRIYRPVARKLARKSARWETDARLEARVTRYSARKGSISRRLGQVSALSACQVIIVRVKEWILRRHARRVTTVRKVHKTSRLVTRGLIIRVRRRRRRKNVVRVTRVRLAWEVALIRRMKTVPRVFGVVLVRVQRRRPMLVVKVGTGALQGFIV